MLTIEDALKQIVPKMKWRPQYYRDCGDAFIFSHIPPGTRIYGGEPMLKVNKITGEETCIYGPLSEEIEKYEIFPILYSKNILERMFEKLFPWIFNRNDVKTVIVKNKEL